LRALGGLMGWLVIGLSLPFLLTGWLLVMWSNHVRPVSERWQRWFAWRPVYVGRDLDCTLWLEVLERTLDHPGSARALYRRPGDTSVQAYWEQTSDEEG
jgi:hypothetical protein